MSGILQLYTRTPTLTAMTAAGLDYVSDGRFELGVGASGPQVVEGFHGVPYDAPVGRIRELIDVCRQVWRREPVVHEGRYYRIPLPEGQGTGLGKPLKLINHPVRERIPITVAALGPKSVEQTAEIADGWLPMFFHPERAGEVWGAVYFRFDGFPWNGFVYTTAAVSTGLDYISKLPPAETRPGDSTSHVLHYFSPEITFAHPQYKQHELIFRYHHRSGVFGTFNNVWGGSNVLALGYRYRYDFFGR